MTEWNSPKRTPVDQSLPTPDRIGSAEQLGSVIAGVLRPFVAISERELSVLRRGLIKDGWKRSIYLQPAGDFHHIDVGEGILSVANRWLEAEVRIPPPAGHYHDFFCECGGRLTIPLDLLPRNEYSCPNCGCARSGQKLDAAVHYLHHNHLAGGALSMALVYGIERDRAYAEKVADILGKYADAYPGPHTDTRTGGLFWQSHDESVWIIALARAYDLIYYSRGFDVEDRKLIEERLFRPVAQGLRNLSIDGNWGSWHLSAVGVVGLAIKDADLVQYALNGLRSQLSDQVGDDGVLPETVHEYHFYALTALVYFAEACYRAGIDVYNWEPSPGKSLKAMFAAPLDYVYSCLRLPAINDGWYDSILPFHLYEIAYRRWNDPTFAEVLRKAYKFGDSPINGLQRANQRKFTRTSFYALLFGRDLPGATAATVFRGRDFPGLGVCTLRSRDDLMATLDYGKLLRHGHNDKLSFTLYANEAVAMPDYGTPGYSSDLLRWSKSTPAHNTVVVDGAEQQPAERNGLLDRRSGSIAQWAEAVSDDCYPGVVHKRKVVLVGRTCIVADELKSETEHDYDWLVRCEGTPSMRDHYARTDLNTEAYREVVTEHAFEFGDCCRLRWKCENGDLGFWMWTDSSKAVAGLGACPTEVTDRTASFFMCRQHGRNAGFLSVFVATRPDEEVEVSRRGSVFRVEGRDFADYVYLRRVGEESSDGMIQTDAELAVVRTVKDEIAAMAVYRGSWVKWNGSTLLEYPSEADCIEVSLGNRSPVVRCLGQTTGVLRFLTSARVTRVNGFRAMASRSGDCALVRITSQMLAADAVSAGS